MSATTPVPRQQKSAAFEYLTTRKDEFVGWARKFSLFPYPFVTACCAMEFMSVSSTLYDTDRFGAALPRFTPRQSDLLMVVGTVSHKQAQVIRTVYDQMCEPRWVMAFGAWWWKERITRAQAIAALAALIGLALASGWVDGALSGAGGSSSYLWGIGLALLNSVGYAALTLIAHRARGLSPLALAWWQCAVGALVLVWWPLTQGWPPLGPAWAWLAGLGVIHTGIAYVVLYAGVARLTAGRVAVLQFVYPASAVGVDWLVYGRALSAGQLVGVLVMLVALVVVGTQKAAARQA